MSDTTFTLQLSAFAAKAKGNADAVVRKVVLDVGRSVVEKSPVDTGRFRANWQHSVAEINEATSAAVDPGGEATIGLLAASIGSLPGTGEIHYLTNSLPYAVRLENGYSKQAPAGMVAVTVIDYQQFVDRAVASLPQ